MMNLSFNKAAQNVQQGGFLFFDRTGISGFWIKKRTARLRSLGRLIFLYNGIHHDLHLYYTPQNRKCQYFLKNFFILSS